MTKCLVIATYNGNYKNSVRLPNQHFFYNVQCTLENTNLDLFDKVIISVAEETNPEFINTGYNTYLKSLEESEKISIVWKPNDVYLSYSSYYEAYKKYPNYDYYYFIEDDYILTDTYVDVAKNEIERNSWGYIFGVINTWIPVVHACHCLCVAKGSALQTIFASFYEKMDFVSRIFDIVHQISFFRIFKVSGIPGEDFKQTPYSLMFWVTSRQTHEYYWNFGKPSIVFPIQYYFYNKLPYPNNKGYDAYLIKNE